MLAIDGVGRHAASSYEQAFQDSATRSPRPDIDEDTDVCIRVDLHQNQSSRFVKFRFMPWLLPDQRNVRFSSRRGYLPF